MNDLNLTGIAIENKEPTIKKSRYRVQDVEKEVGYKLGNKHAVAYVDGSNDKGKKYGYGMIYFSDKGVVEAQNSYTDKYKNMRNVSGEIKGAIAAIKRAIKEGKSLIHIYYDYEGIEKWATGRWKRNKEGTISYKAFIDSSLKKIDIKFHKVKAHNKVYFNEVADKLAKEAVFK